MTVSMHSPYHRLCQMSYVNLETTWWQVSNPHTSYKTKTKICHQHVQFRRYEVFRTKTSCESSCSSLKEEIKANVNFFGDKSTLDHFNLIPFVCLSGCCLEFLKLKNIDRCSRSVNLSAVTDLTGLLKMSHGVSNNQFAIPGCSFMYHFREKPDCLLHSSRFSFVTSC